MAKYNDVLKELRKKNNLTQAELAKYLNMTQRTYAHYEKGDREPNIETLILLAEKYGVPVDVLIGRYELSK